MNPTDRDRAVAAAYLSGVTLQQAADRAGVHVNTASKSLRRCGVALRSRSERQTIITPTVADSIVSAYLGGDTGAAIASRIGVEPTCIFDALERRGVTRRPPTQTSRKHTLDESAFEADTPESRYWAGFLLADGCVTDNSLLTVALAARDRPHLEALRSFLSSSHPIAPQPKTGSFRYCVGSRHLVASLAAYGVVPRKSLTARVPERFSSDRDYWRGVVDGDGGVTIKTTRYKQSVYRRPYVGLCGPLALCEQFRDFGSAAASNFGSVFRNGSIWSVVFNGSYAVPVIDTLYRGAGAALGRKADVAARVLADYLTSSASA